MKFNVGDRVIFKNDCILNSTFVYDTHFLIGSHYFNKGQKSIIEEIVEHHDLQNNKSIIAVISITKDNMKYSISLGDSELLELDKQWYRQQNIEKLTENEI